MRTKAGVYAVELHPAARYAIEVARLTYLQALGEVATVSSASDEAPSRREASLHYGRASDGRCRAFDLRLPSLRPNDAAAFAALLRTRLGVDFDVVVEASHFHVEYDPKWLRSADAAFLNALRTAS